VRAAVSHTAQSRVRPPVGKWPTDDEPAKVDYAGNMRAALVVVLMIAGCGGGTSANSATGGGAMGGGGAAQGGGGGQGDGGQGGQGGQPSVDKSQGCADTFGDGLTATFGRLDGTVHAVVKPTDTHCTLFNDDHLVVQVAMNGAIYRMVVNIDNIGYLNIAGALVGEAWSEGWHEAAVLDYPADLGVTANEFTTTDLTTLANTVTDAITVGDPISVFAESSGGTFASSAHLIHRNNGKSDGALVLDPTSSAPRYLLFRFDNQVF
jgi:hypothetical protein